MPEFYSLFKRNLFFRVPAISTKMSLTELSKKRREEWIRVIYRKDITDFKSVRVCPKHFASGRSSDLKDVGNPDWIPTQNLYRPSKIGDGKSAMGRFNRAKARAAISRNGLLANVSNQVSVVATNSQINVETAVEYSKTLDNIHLREQRRTTETLCLNFDLFETNGQYLQEKMYQLQAEINKSKFDLKEFKDDDAKTRFFTGISSYTIMHSLFKKLEPDLPEWCKTLTKFEIFCITFNKLRLNLPFRYYKYRFNVSEARSDLKLTMPQCFKVCFGDRITVIIDCFEILIERPSNMKIASQCWSNYKHDYTIKYMIGISPQDHICYISDGYAGRASDKFICENCGFLDMLEENDVVMADKGFLIADSIKQAGAYMEMSAFVKNRSQLHPFELENTRKVANVRIHVERVIGKIRQKYKATSQRKFPLKCVSKTTGHASILDQIVMVPLLLLIQATLFSFNSKFE